MTPEQFKAAMAALPEPPNDSHPPLWDFWRHNLWTRAQIDDPRQFDKWPCIYHTMLVNHWAEYIAKQYERVKLKPRLLAETHLPPYPLDKFADTPYSMNLIHQAHHLYIFLDTLGLQIRRNKSVVEFGGGYGAMALLMRRLGMADTYHIIDLPEFALLQQFYISQMGVAERVTWNAPEHCDLLISCHGLSEIPTDVRDGWIDRLRPRKMLFLYNSQFADDDNVAYFQKHLPAYFSNLRFTHISCDAFLPTGSWYTLGW